MKKKPAAIDLSRRKFLTNLAGAPLAVSLPLGFSPSASAVTTATQPFLLTISLGSWDGKTSGLIQPPEFGKWPLGFFVSNTTNGCLNSLVNQHTQVGKFIFHNYSKPLIRIADRLAVGAVNSRSAGHNTPLQGRGVTGNAGWLAGWAQRIAEQTGKVTLVNGASFTTDINSSTSSFVGVTSNDLSGFRALYADGTSIVKNAYATDIWSNYHQFRGADTIPGLTSGILTSIGTYASNLHNGLPAELSTTSPVITDVNSFITQAKADLIIDQDLGVSGDGDAVKALGPQTSYMIDRLRVAAILAKTGFASGAHISASFDHNYDLHAPYSTSEARLAGSSSVLNARHAAMTWAQIVVFWDWVRAQGLEHRVMIIVYHEFGRGAYNKSVASGKETVVTGSGSVALDSVGTDHALHAGYFFIGGRVPAGNRFGAVGVGHAAFGTKRGDGIPDPSIPGYTSTELVVSMLMRTYPELFPDQASIRNFWGRDFNPLSEVLGA